MNTPYRFASFVLIILFLSCNFAFAEDTEWQPVTGNENLRNFMSDTKLEWAEPGGGSPWGEYRADGTGVLHAWGESFPRTWEVKGDDQICVTGKPASACYKLEKSKDDPTLYRSTEVGVGTQVEIRLSKDGKIAVAKGAPTGASPKGGAGAASADEMAAKLSNPSAALASMNNNFIYTQFDGDMPGAKDQGGWTYLFQPVIPFPMKKANLLFRPGIPVRLNMPVPLGGGEYDTSTDLGDISYDLATVQPLTTA